MFDYAGVSFSRSGNWERVFKDIVCFELSNYLKTRKNMLVKQSCSVDL